MDAPRAARDDDWNDAEAAPPALVAPSPPAAPPTWVKRGTPAYHRIVIALFLAGFSTFSLLYCVQPLLPEFAATYRIVPSVASLALSLTTGFLAVAILAAGAFSQMVSRRRLMFASMALAALFNLAAACAPGWETMLIARAAVGLVLGGVPAVAMAYLAEEIDPAHLGKAMGVYVAGTAFGGMAGRVGMGILTETLSWRMAMGVLSVIDIAAAIGFVLLLPASRNFVAQRSLALRSHLRSWQAHLRHRGLIRLFGIGFVLTSVFVTLFNYAGFRLSAAPFHLGQTAISMIFLTYALGMVASSSAGGLADSWGRVRTLATGLALLLAGIALTLIQSLVAIVAGIALVTIGFFIAHSVASGWVGRLAGKAKGHASSLYLLAYYLGSSFVGSLGGWFWQHGGWPAVAALTGALTLVGVALLASLRRVTGESR